jgi:hypothetical protein
MRDPPTTNNNYVFIRPVQGIAQAFNATVSTAGQLSIAPKDIAQLEAVQGTQTAPRFAEVRIRRIQVWGPDQVATTGLVQSNIGLALTAPQGDNFSATDFGCAGAERATVAITPNMSMREHWYDTTSTTGIFNILNTGITSTGVGTQAVIVLRVTCDFR